MFATTIEKIFSFDIVDETKFSWNTEEDNKY